MEDSLRAMDDSNERDMPQQPETGSRSGIFPFDEPETVIVVGFIDGGDTFDVLGMGWLDKAGKQIYRIRVRFEATGRVEVGEGDAEMDFSQTMTDLASELSSACGQLYRARILTGAEIKKFFEAANEAAKETFSDY